ncbi:MAG: diphosphomevalonate decarboxylase [Thermoplasmatota archaeon]
MSKSSAIAHPIQGLIKYHGLLDPVRRIPFHDSISVCTGPIHSHTTFELTNGDQDQAVIDGKEVTGRALERIHAVVDAIREHADDDRCWRMESRNDFPQFVGLGSSSSGFAALTVAAADAFGYDASMEKLSEIARLGAGSACRAVTGGVSEWVNDGARSYSRRILAEDELDWRIVVPLVQHEEPTEGVHEEVKTSPLFEARVAYMPEACDALRRAAAAKDLPAIGALAEADTLNLHAITMTGQAGHLTWQPATIHVMQAVKRLRKEGVPVWFSIDTGATAYLNTDAAHETQVAEAVAGIEGVADVLHLLPAGPARRVEEHLF